MYIYIYIYIIGAVGRGGALGFIGIYIYVYTEICIQIYRGRRPHLARRDLCAAQLFEHRGQPRLQDDVARRLCELARAPHRGAAPRRPVQVADVLRLDVAVHDAVKVEVLQPARARANIYMYMYIYTLHICLQHR